MAYPYFCTHCGKELNQEIVLFNMFPVLTGSSENGQFTMLRFRMTKKELEKLVDSGTKLENGYSRCRLSFAEVMRCIGNCNNNSISKINGITLQDVDEYIVEEETDSAREKVSWESLFDTVEEPEEELPACEKVSFSEGIMALEEAISWKINIMATRESLRKEFRILREAFSQEDFCEFELILDTEEDNDGKPVLIGYTANAGTPKRLVVENNRLCPYCGNSIIEHAGTAEHKIITFIGGKGSGKTSTIVALAHYALSAADNTKRTGIWKESVPVDGIDFIELVSKDSACLDLLHMYERGIAPEKTFTWWLRRGHELGFSFRIKNAVQHKHYLLTLTEVPSDLFDDTVGRLSVNTILERLPIVLDCDVFVLCVDMYKSWLDSPIFDRMNSTGMCIEQIQQLRQEYNHRDEGLLQKVRGDGPKALSAPIMILYTECPDLEDPEDNPLPMSHTNAFDRIARTYMYDEERRRIDNHHAYSFLNNWLTRFDMVSNAYRARLRCSPFGYKAPSKHEVVDKGEESLLSPKPKHIDLLMRWLLMVSGCMPVPAEFRPYADPTSTEVYKYDVPYFLPHTQYRTLNPGTTAPAAGKNADLREALARCYLFENPGQVDSSILANYDNRIMLLIERIKARRQRN